MRKLLQKPDYKKDDDAKGPKAKSSLPVTVVREVVGVVYSRRSGKPTFLGWIVVIATIVYFMTHAFKRQEPKPDRDDVPEINPRFHVQKMFPIAPDPDPQHDEFQRVVEKNKAGKDPLEMPEFDPNAHQAPKHVVENRMRDIYGHPRPKDYPVPVLMQPDDSLLCEGEILLLIIHESPVVEAMERNAVRNTWGRQSPEDIKKRGKLWATMFVTGVPHSNYNANITDEALKNKDVLQGDFVDSPHEGTRKFMLAMDWIMNVLTDTCRPHYIIKTKEKIFHNIPAIIHWIQNTLPKSNLALPDVYVGKVLRKDIPIRDPEDFGYVDEDDFPDKYFPDLIQAPEYFFSLQSFRRLHETKPGVTPVAVEDAYIGLLAAKAGMVPMNDDHFIMMRILKSDLECHYAKAFFVYNVSPSEHHKFHRKVGDALNSGRCHL